MKKRLYKKLIHLPVGDGSKDFAVSVPGFLKFGRIVVNKHTKKASLEVLAEFLPHALRVKSTQFIKLLVNCGAKFDLEYEKSQPTFIGFVPSLKKYQKQYCVHAFSHTHPTMKMICIKTRTDMYSTDVLYTDSDYFRWESALAISNSLTESFI